VLRIRGACGDGTHCFSFGVVSLVPSLAQPPISTRVKDRMTYTVNPHIRIDLTQVKTPSVNTPSGVFDIALHLLFFLAMIGLHLSLQAVHIVTW
jgi:hypothetical protein